MSWLSKLVGGKTLKIAAIAGAGYFGNQYLWGKTAEMGAPGDGIFGYDDSTFAGRTFNALGIKPFSETTVGSFLEPYLGGKRAAMQAAGYGVGNVINSLSASQRFERMPSPGTIQPTGVRTDTNFGAGQAQMLPIGSRGQLDAALGSEAMRQYMAKQVRMMNLPGIQGLPSVDMSGTTLAATTSQRRRSYKSMTGS